MWFEAGARRSATTQLAITSVAEGGSATTALSSTQYLPDANDWRWRLGRRRHPVIGALFALADVIGLVLAFAVSQAIFLGHHGGAEDQVVVVAEILLFALTLPAWLLLAKSYRLYDLDDVRNDHATPDDLVTVFHLVTVGVWITFVGASLTSRVDPHLPKLIAFWVLAVVLVPAARALARGVAARQSAYLQNTVIAGAGDVGQLVAEKILRHPEYGLRLVGFVDSAPRDRRDTVADVPHLGVLADMPQVASVHEVDRVIVAFSSDSNERTLALLRSLKDLNVRIDIVPRLFDVLGPNARIGTLEGLPLLGLPAIRLSRAALLLKRMMDVALSLAGIVALAPLFLYLAIRVKLDSPGPVLYRQPRPGRDGRPFQVIKFRTMYLDACRGSGYGGAQAEAAFEQLVEGGRTGAFGHAFKLREDPRVTPFGRWLRRVSLDELPQLFNVLRGEMSLVGPRPVPSSDAEMYAATGSGLPTMTGLRPGITGYWQINGRSEVSYEERVRLDTAYATGWSLRLDLLILLKTARVLALGRGAY